MLGVLRVMACSLRGNLGPPDYRALARCPACLVVAYWRKPQPACMSPARLSVRWSCLPVGSLTIWRPGTRWNRCRFHRTTAEVRLEKISRQEPGVPSLSPGRIPPRGRRARASRRAATTPATWASIVHVPPADRLSAPWTACGWQAYAVNRGLIPFMMGTATTDGCANLHFFSGRKVRSASRLQPSRDISVGFPPILSYRPKQRR